MSENQTNNRHTPVESERNYVPATTVYGHHMLVPLNDTIGDSILKHGIYDGKGVCMMNAILRQMLGAVVLDIGANIGNHTLAMSTVAEKIYAFEPQRGVFDILSQNITSNDIDNVSPFNLGLSTEEQELELFIPATDNIGAATLRNELRSENAIVEKIKLARGDDLVATLELDHLDLIKVDVEGFEIQVLDGLSNTLDKFKPIIFMEWDQDITKRDAASSELFQQLLTGYQAWQVGSNRDRDLWPDSLWGRLQRIGYKAVHKRHWLLRSADLAQSYGNLVLVPESRLQLIEAIGPQNL